MGMATTSPPVRCAFCDELASRFFLTLDNTLWCVCPGDAQPFLKIAAEMDPEKYDFDFEISYEPCKGQS